MNYFVKLFIYRIMRIGSIPLCNGIASRAPEIFGFCFPLCYRCTFIFLFIILTYLFIRHKSQINIIWTPVLMLPMLVDGSLQTFMMIESTNLRRSITGALFGIAVALLLKRAYLFIDKEKPA